MFNLKPQTPTLTQIPIVGAIQGEYRGRWDGFHGPGADNPHLQQGEREASGTLLREGLDPHVRKRPNSFCAKFDTITLNH